MNAHWRVRCIASLRVHVVYCEPDATVHCNASLHDAGIELKSIQAFFNDTMRRDVMHYVYCEPAFRLLSPASLHMHIIIMTFCSCVGWFKVNHVFVFVCMCVCVGYAVIIMFNVHVNV